MNNDKKQILLSCIGKFEPNYIIKEHQVQAVLYEPHNLPKYVQTMIEKGLAKQFKDPKTGMFELRFGNKRGEYIALQGDYIVRDQHNHVYVISATTFASRTKRI